MRHNTLYIPLRLIPPLVVCKLSMCFYILSVPLKSPSTRNISGPSAMVLGNATYTILSFAVIVGKLLCKVMFAGQLNKFSVSLTKYGVERLCELYL